MRSMRSATLASLASDTASISAPAARLAIWAAAATILLLASLHVLSPEFDPASRMVSEYANGRYGWVLSLMFLTWAVSTWALAFAIRSQLTTTAGKIGLGILIVAGVGEALASVFDINHPGHMVASIGLLCLPIAAMLISVSLGRARAWSTAKQSLLWTANLTWVILVLMVAAVIVMMVGFTQAGNTMTADVIALHGYPNRLLIVLYCVWVMHVAWHAIKLKGQTAPEIATQQ